MSCCPPPIHAEQLVTATPDRGEHPDRSLGADNTGREDPIPEWAPIEPLPPSAMILATFNGHQQVTASDILHPAADLVDCHRRYRRAWEHLASSRESFTPLTAAAGDLLSAQTDIEILVDVINDAVAVRLEQFHHQTHTTPSPVLDPAPIDGLPLQPVHTESIGEVLARIADLWAVLHYQADPVLGFVPMCAQLLELCRGYDCLAAEVETGRRLLPGL